MQSPSSSGAFHVLGFFFFAFSLVSCAEGIISVSCTFFFFSVILFFFLIFRANLHLCVITALLPAI